MKKLISIIIPCYNESENLKRGVLEQVDQYLCKRPDDYEVIISDDESTDESLRIVKEATRNLKNFRLLENLHGGKPFAIRAGVEAAAGEICLFTDMDQSTPISELEKLLPYFNQGFEVVIGSRGSERKNFPWHRQLMSFVFRLLRRTMILRDLIDTQCGFKACRTKAGKEIFNKMTIFKKRGKGWRVGAWDVEFLFVAEKLGFKVKEVFVAWKDRDITQGKKRNFVKESKEMFFEILRVRVNDWKRRYG